MATISVSFGDHTVEHDSASGALEFGRNPRGITTLPRDAQLAKHVHNRCGAFWWDGTWLLGRGHRTPNIELVVTTIAADGWEQTRVLTEHQPVVRLVPGDGRAELTVRGQGGTSAVLVLSWHISPAPTAPPRFPGPVDAVPDTEDILIDDVQAEYTRPGPTVQIELSDYERSVIAVYAKPFLLGDSARVTVTAADAAEAVHGDRAAIRGVNKALYRIKTKITAAQTEMGEEPFVDRPGVKSSPLLAEWLVRNEVITADDLPNAPS